MMNQKTIETEKKTVDIRLTNKEWTKTTMNTLKLLINQFEQLSTQRSETLYFHKLLSNTDEGESIETKLIDINTTLKDVAKKTKLSGQVLAELVIELEDYMSEDLDEHVTDETLNYGENLAIGLKSGQVELINTSSTTNTSTSSSLNKNSDKYTLYLHKDRVSALKFSQQSDWLVSAGYDTYLYGCLEPNGMIRFYPKQNSSLLCCDVSANDQYIITASFNTQATLYELEH